MPQSGSVTDWLGQLRAGDDEAAQRLWERYYERLVRLADSKLGGARRSVADEEDVVAVAFNSFCRGAKAGRFPQLVDRDSLWPLLITLTERKAIDQNRWLHAAKRGGGRVRGESGFDDGRDSDPAAGGIENAISREPSPDFAALVAEECQQRFAMLHNETLRTIARLHLEGFRNREIGDRLQIGVRSVERKVALIRQIWRGDAGQSRCEV